MRYAERFAPHTILEKILLFHIEVSVFGYRTKEKYDFTCFLAYKDECEVSTGAGFLAPVLYSE